MQAIIGIVLILGGIALGAYLGLWVCFVGGIVQIVEAVKATPVQSMGIAVGLLRIFLTGVVGWGTFGICALIGGAFLQRKRR